MNLRGYFKIELIKKKIRGYFEIESIKKKSPIESMYKYESCLILKIYQTHIWIIIHFRTIHLAVK